jgi:hypothetical protein
VFCCQEHGFCHRLTTERQFDFYCSDGFSNIKRFIYAQAYIAENYKTEILKASKSGKACDSAARSLSARGTFI